MKYCTYVKYYGLRGFLYGWFLVGISPDKKFGGYAADFMASSDNFQMMLLEMEPPLVINFWLFRPYRSKIVNYLTFRSKKSDRSKGCNNEN